MDHEGLPTRLRFLRQARGLSYHALARLSGVTHTSLHQIEAGNNIPGLDTAEKIALALGLILDGSGMGSVIHPQTVFFRLP